MPNKPAKALESAIESTKVELDAPVVRVIVVQQDNGNVVCSPRLTLTEAACQISGSLVEALKQLLIACSLEELNTISEWLLDEQVRREGIADSPTDARTTHSVATKETF